jgi:hypothetical protein
VPPVFAEDATTNQVTLSFSGAAPDYDVPQGVDIMASRFLERVVASDNFLFDRLTGPAARLSWGRKEARLGYRSIEHMNSRGAKMFASLGLDSLRMAAVESLPLESWGGWFSDLVTGTLGNPEEERVPLTSISYSAVRSSWERGSSNGGIQWGFRPWRTSPYMYVQAHAGHLDGHPLLAVETRAGYTLLGESAIEGRLALQLPGSFRLAGAGAFDPGKMNGRARGGTRFSFTLERALRHQGMAPESIFFLGFRSSMLDLGARSRAANVLVAGLSTTW